VDGTRIAQLPKWCQMVCITLKKRKFSATTQMHCDTTDSRLFHTVGPENAKMEIALKAGSLQDRTALPDIQHCQSTETTSLQPQCKYNISTD